MLVFLIKCFGCVNMAIHDDVENAKRKVKVKQQDDLNGSFEQGDASQDLVETACYMHRLHSTLCLILNTIEIVVDRCSGSEREEERDSIRDAAPTLLWSAIGFLRMPGQRSAARLATVRIIRQVLECIRPSLQDPAQQQKTSKAISDARPCDSEKWDSFFLLGETREHYPPVELELSFQLHNLSSPTSCTRFLHTVAERRVKAMSQGRGIALGAAVRNEIVAAAGLPHLVASLVGHYSSVDDSPGLHGSWTNTEYILAGECVRVCTRFVLAGGATCS